MGRFFACAGLGTFFTLAASVLAIFAHISQINSNIVPRHIRMTTVSTTGVGAATGAGDAVYGSGDRSNNQPNTGLRPYYEWGLWGYCASQTTGGNRDYCSGTSWAYEFQPVPAVVYDVPANAQQTISNALGQGTFTSSDYLGRFTKAAFYLLIIGTILGGLALVIGFLAHRVAFLLAAVLAFLGFLLTIAGCIIWVVILSRVRSSINGNGSGVNVSYGNALWIYFASSGCLLFATLPYIFSCIAGRDRYY